MEPLAIEWGIPSDKYWELTFNEIMMQVTANKKNYERQLKEKAMFDYNQAQLFGFAFNDPSKMPKFNDMYSFGKSEQIKQAETISQEEIDLMNFQKWAVAIKQNREQEKR